MTNEISIVRRKNDHLILFLEVLTKSEVFLNNLEEVYLMGKKYYEEGNSKQIEQSSSIQ